MSVYGKYTDGYIKTVTTTFYFTGMSSHRYNYCRYLVP